MVTRYDGAYSRAARSGWLLVPPNSIVTALDYPVTIPGDSVSGYLLKVQSGTVAGTGTIRCVDYLGNLKNDFSFGVQLYGADARAYNSYGGSKYAGLRGTGATAVLWLPDGSGTTPGQQQFAGTGPPSATTIPMAASKGDIYWQGRDLCSLIAETYTQGVGTASQTVGASGGTGTQILTGTPAVGDLVVVVACCNNGTGPTMTIGATSGITDDYANSDSSTDRIYFYSHVVQSGDISSNRISFNASTTLTGSTSRIMVGMIFRNPTGWPTTGAKFQCPLTGSAYVASSSGASATPTISGPLTDVSVSVAAGMQASTTTSPGLTFLWDASGSTSNENSDSPGGTNTYPSGVSARPGVGTNTTGKYPYGPGGYNSSSADASYFVNAPGGPTSQCQISGFTAAAFLAAIVNYSPNPITSPATYGATTYSGGTPIMWKCSVGGSTFASQTWVQKV